MRLGDVLSSPHDWRDFCEATKLYYFPRHPCGPSLARGLGAQQLRHQIRQHPDLPGPRPVPCTPSPCQKGRPRASRSGCFQMVFILCSCMRRQLLKYDLKKEFEGFPGGAVVENLPANAGDTGSSPGLGRSHIPWSN